MSVFLALKNKTAPKAGVKNSAADDVAQKRTNEEKKSPLAPPEITMTQAPRAQDELAENLEKAEIQTSESLDAKRKTSTETISKAKSAKTRSVRQESLASKIPNEAGTKRENLVKKLPKPKRIKAKLSFQSLALA